MEQKGTDKAVPSYAQRKKMRQRDAQNKVTKGFGLAKNGRQHN